MIELIIGVLGLFYSIFGAITHFSHEWLIPVLADPLRINVTRWCVAAVDPANCIGAAIGGLIAVFVRLPWVGLPGAMVAAGALNLMVAGLAWHLAREPEPAASALRGHASRRIGAIFLMARSPPFIPVPERNSSPGARRAPASSASSAPAAAAARSGRRSRLAAADGGLEARILEAALQEFSEHGFAGARIERISAGAGTVDRMLYYYYGNKERLYQAVLEQAYAQMIGAQRAFVTPDDPVAAMRQLVEHSWDHYANHPHLVRLLMNENLLRGRHIVQSEQVGPTSFPLVETVTTVLEAGQAQGVFRADAQATQVLMTIMSLGFFYLSNQHTCSSWIGVDLMTRTRRHSWRAHICDVVLDYLGAPAPVAATALAPDAGVAQATPPASKPARRRAT